jgi:hypothetical protein
MSDNIKLDNIKTLLSNRDYDKIQAELNKDISNIKQEIELFKKYLENPLIIPIKRCSRCGYIKELVRVRGCWCIKCKNEYECERRNKIENREKINTKSREKYEEKKKQVLLKPVEINLNDNKTCSICRITKTLDNFFQAKCKGTFRAGCKECTLKHRKEYYKKNAKQIINQTNNYKKIKMKIDPGFKMERLMRARMYDAFINQNLKKPSKSRRYLGCTSKFFKDWIEFQLYGIMRLDNYGEIWHLDHVKPCASFDLSKESDIKECFSWKNIRPCLASENYSKKDKIIPYQIEMQEFKANYFESTYQDF